MTIWTNTNKNTSSWTNTNKSGSSISYMAGKVGYAKVGMGRVGATVGGTITGAQWSYSNKS